MLGYEQQAQVYICQLGDKNWGSMPGNDPIKKETSLYERSCSLGLVWLDQVESEKIRQS